jgi:prolipoprotein diacylglyceryl transferase
MFIWNLNPILIDLGPLEIRYYGVFFALALSLAYYIGRDMVHRKGLSAETFDSLTIYLIVGLILGARAGHIIFYELTYYAANPWQILKIWQGGLSSHGATIGVITAYAIFLWRHRKSRFFDFADIIVIVTCIPAAFVRLGNFCNSELVGRPTPDGLPWATVFQHVDSVPRHPSQIYEFLMAAVIFAILYPLWRKKHGHGRSQIPSRVFAGLFLVLYFSARFSVEFFKDFPLHAGFFNLTTGQILSLPFIAGGALILLFTKYTSIKHKA